VIKTVAWPNPNPQHIAVELSGPVSSLTIEIFSEDLDLVAEFSTGAEPGAWTELGLPSAFLATAPAGTYFYRVMVGTQTHGGAIGRFVLTK